MTIANILLLADRALLAQAAYAKPADGRDGEIRPQALQRDASFTPIQTPGVRVELFSTKTFARDSCRPH